MDDKNNEKIVYITGGGGKSNNALNISTISSIVLASCGVKVIKHVSCSGAKKCSSASLLDELKIKTAKSINDIEESFERDGIVFIESEPDTTLKNLCPFVTLGYNVTRVIGINDSLDASKYILQLKDEGCENAIIMCPDDENFDEASVCSPTKIFELKYGSISEYLIHPEIYGMKSYDKLELTGATPLYNANLTEKILSAKQKGAKLDVLALNVGIMLYISGFTQSILKGIIQAYKTIESNQAFNKLEQLRR